MKLILPFSIQEPATPRADELYAQHQEHIYGRASRMFAVLMLLQWLTGIAAALWLSPRTWAGAESEVHPHVWQAIFFGAIIAVPPIFLARAAPAAASTRHVVAFGQALTSALLIHLTGGRLETHFHVFGSLAFLAFYRDWRVLVTASAVVAADHYLRGIYWPQSIYGVAIVDRWRWFEHAAWVLFEDAFLVYSIYFSCLEMRSIAKRQARLEQSNACIELDVARRTAELARATSRLQGVLDGATQVAIIATDLSGTITVFNAGAERLLGYSAQEMVGQETPAKFHLPTELAERERNLSLEAGRHIKGFEVLVARARVRGHDEREWTYLRKDGHHRSVAAIVTSMRDSDGARVGFLVVAMDITERKRLTERLLVQSAALKWAANGVLITDHAGIIQWVNPAFTALTGYTADEAIGQTPRILKSGKEPRELFSSLWATIRAGRVWQGELINKRKDGTFYDEEMTVTPVHGADGRITQFVAIKQDITKRRQAEGELRQAKEAAEAATRAKSEFLANMSHEIRTPMNGVIGMTGLLLDTALTEEQRGQAETIRTSAESLLTVINDILDFSKIEAGKLSFETIDFNLRETVEDTLELLAAQAQSKGIELVGNVEPDVAGHLRGDPGRLRQVLTNLLGNAIKFTAMGEVALRVTLESHAGKNVLLRFEIRDTGAGIAPEVQARLFKPFSQADGSTSRKFGGTGLGLAICKQLTHALGGRIGVQSTPGQGSRFWFTMNFEQGAAGPARLEREHDLIEARVLIVDDNETNCQFLHRQMEAWRMRVEIARSGLEAITLLRAAAAAADPYTLAVIDSDVPPENGCALASQIKADPVIASTRLVMLTPFGKPLDAGDALAHGIAACRSKPVRQSALFDCLTETMAGSVSGTKNGGKAPRPFAPPPDEAAHDPGEVPPVTASDSSLRILVAEDNNINLRVTLGYLRKLGYRADVAANGLEVLRALEVADYDVILMDCQMPEMDGYEATMEIRRRETSGHHTWLIAMTAHSMTGDREACLAAGMDDYVSKPVRRADLAAALDRSHPAAAESRERSLLTT